MAGEGAERLLLADACVLIDFLEACPEVLGILSRNLGVLHVARPVLDEVSLLDDAGCGGMGIVIIEPTGSQFGEAAAGAGGLSFQDWVCLIVSRDEHMTCLTNDAALIAACRVRGVPTMRALRCLLDLVGSGALTGEAAMSAAEAIHSRNPRHINAVLLETLRQQLRSLEEGT